MEIPEMLAKTEPSYDRMKELKDFDETKAGVKGLVDAGVTTIPRIFVRPSEEIESDLPVRDGVHGYEVPVISLEGIEKADRRKEIVDCMRHASETGGFFQLVNHGVPANIMEEMIESTRRFHEQDVEVKKQYYARDMNKNVNFNSNYDLYKTRTASWRDTLLCNTRSPTPLNREEFPEICRDIILEYTDYITSLGDTVMELLSEALGLKSDYLKSMECTKWCSYACHYYPECPEPELTLGSPGHSDPSFLTVLLQDDTGGLQVVHQNHWVDVIPIRGALVVNIGDLLQLMTNDKFRSAEHRVVSSHVGPRISIAGLFSTAASGISSLRLYGPIKELLSEDNPPIYKEISVLDYVSFFNSEQLNGYEVKALTYFKL